MHDALGFIGSHALTFLSGSTAMGIVAHAVNTFPQPKSAFWSWVLGTIQYAVGQRTQAAVTKSTPPTA
jgi:hypothetical protein